MSALRICTIVGARPQFVKAAVVSRAVRDLQGENVKEIILHTGQHYDSGMSDVFFDEMEIPRPDHHLKIGGGTHGQNTGRMIERIEAVLQDVAPDLVLVYGDTDSTLAGAIAAVKLHIPVAHVEAGLRSFNRRMPEEINRVLTDHASDMLFTPTELASKNLSDEGVDQEKVHQVGDVMYDAALYYSALADQRSDVLRRLDIEPGHFALATIHRAENTDDRARISGILAGLARSNLPVLLPIHPRTKKRLADFGLALPPSVRAIDPIGYFDMIVLERSAAVIVTDSGGVQKEAFFHEVPCVTLRDETEWMELVEAGANVLVGTDPDRIDDAVNTFRPDLTNARKLYGEGAAGATILRTIIDD